MVIKFYSVVLLLCLCCATIVAQRELPHRQPSRPRLVDVRPGYSPLYQSSDETKRRNGSYIVKLKDTRKLDDLGRIMAKLTTQAQSSDSSDEAVVVQGLSGYSMVGLGMMAILNQKALDEVRQDSSVAYVEENQIIEISAESWHTDRVDQRNLPLNKKFCPPNGGEGVDIYILDTGINYCHEDFCLDRARFAGYSPVVTAENVNAKGEDCHGHGTHVAALAAGGIHGIARKARVYSLPVFNCQGRGGSTISLIQALNHVAQRATANPERRTIISMSLTAPLSQAVNEAVSRIALTEELPQGILVVAAAGNFKGDACHYSPASSNNTVTVGGTAENDTLYWRSRTGTNFGRCVDIFAPGSEVTSASYPSCNGESVMSGTSMATPIVSGAAAIIWSNDMSLTQAQVKEKLMSQSTKDILDFSDLAPSQRRVTPNKLVYTNKIRCSKIKKDKNPCEPSAGTTLCGKAWDFNATTLVTSIDFDNLQTTINHHRSNSLIPVYISPYLNGTSLYFAVIFKSVSNFRDYRIEIGLSTKAVTRRVEKLNRKNFYVTFATSYSENRKIFHILVFQKMIAQPTSQLYLAQSEADYESSARSNRDLSVTCLTVTINAEGAQTYTTLYERSDEKTVVQCNLRFKSIIRKVTKQKNKGFTLKSVDTYMVNDETRYCAVFTNQTIGECDYIFMHSYGEKDINDIAETHRNEGYRIIAVAVHSQRAFPLFMAVFKK